MHHTPAKAAHRNRFLGWLMPVERFVVPPFADDGTEQSEKKRHVHILGVSFLIPLSLVVVYSATLGLWSTLAYNLGFLAAVAGILYLNRHTKVRGLELVLLYSAFVILVAQFFTGADHPRLAHFVGFVVFVAIAGALGTHRQYILFAGVNVVGMVALTFLASHGVLGNRLGTNLPLWMPLSVGVVVAYGAFVVGLANAERNHALQRSRSAAERYTMLYELAGDAILLVHNNLIVHHNRRARTMFACDSDWLIGKSIDAITPEIQPDGGRSRDRAEQVVATLVGHEHATFEMILMRQDGTPFTAEINLNVVSMEGERYLLALLRDTTVRKQQDERIRRSLAEKEVLLKELHHRVKNNLQIMSSILNMQASRSPEAAVRDELSESRRRIRAMALVHEQLYTRDAVSAVNFGDYLRQIVGEISAAFKKNGITITTEAEDISLGIDIAVPCGIVVNELVTNALKHAFPDDGSGTVHVAFKRTAPEMLTIEVADDGCGFPADRDHQTMESLGMTLVTNLAYQIHGETQLIRDHGTRFVLTFEG